MSIRGRDEREEGKLRLPNGKGGVRLKKKKKRESVKPWKIQIFI